MAAVAAVACSLAAASGCGGAEEDVQPRAPALELLAGFDEPLYLTQAERKGPLYVVERAGKVRAVSAEGDVSQQPFLDLRGRVTTEGEGGLFSIAFPPDHARSGLLYAAYAGRDRRLHLDEFARAPDSDRADPATRREVLAIEHPTPVHWGGLALFGPDGRLYLGTGEGGPVFPISEAAQDRSGLLGKILRIDPRSGRHDVHVLGLRNPWRFSFDRATGDLWIGDVGDFREEEIDHLPPERIAGANLGWPALEGRARTQSDLKPPADAVEPVLTYERTGRPDDPFCAITGGYVVRDPGLPSLEGRYLYGDFCEGTIRSFELRHGRAHDDRPTGLEVPRLASFAEDADGHLYPISLKGPVYRIVER